MTEPIFKSVRFYTTGDVPRKVEELLESGGARREAYFTDYTTHLIVGDNPDETVVNEAHDLYERPALRSFWVVMCQHAGRMLPPTGFIYTTGALFADLVVTCSQLTREDVSTVWAVVTAHGGRFRCDLTPGCTHLVCGTAEGVKYSRALAENITIVTPDWLVLSVQHGRLLDASAYHPRLLLGSGSEGLSSDLAAPGGSLDSLLSSITGFGGDSDIPERLATSGGGVGVQQPPVEVEQVASEQQKQQLLAKLKQTLPWNQQQMETSSVDVEEKSASNGSIFTSSSATTASSSSTSTLTSSQTGASISLAEQTRRQLAIGQQSLPSDERSQHVKTSEVYDQAQRVQPTEVPDQKQHVQLTEVPDQKQHVQSMEVPDQKQHAHSTEVPDQKQHVESMEMSDQKQNVQPTDVPDQKQHVHSMEVSEHQQESLCQVTTPQIASQTIQTESVQQASPVSLSQQQRQLEVQSKQLSYSTKLLQQLQQNPAPATVDSIRQSQLQAQSNVQQKLIPPQQPQNRIQISQPIQRRMNSPQLQQPSQSPLQIQHQMQSPHQVQQIQQQSQSPQQIQQPSQSPQQMQQPSQSPLQIQHQMQSPHQIQQIQQQSQSPQQIQHPNQSPQQMQQQMQSPQQIQHPNQSPQQMQQQIQSPQQFHQIQQPSQSPQQVQQQIQQIQQQNQSPQQVQQQIQQIQQQNQSPQQIHQMQSPQQIQQIQQQMQSPQQIHQIQQSSQSPQQTQQQMQSPQQMQQQSQSPLHQMQSPQQQIQSPQQIQQQIQSSQQQMQSSQQAHQIQQQIQSPQQQIQQVQQQTQPAQPVSFNQQSQQQQFQTVPRLPTAQQPVGVEQLQAGGPAATGTASVGTQLQQQPGWRPQQLQQQTATGQRSVWIDERILQIQERLAGMEPQQRQQFLERMDPQQRNLFISHIHRQRLLQQQQQQQQQQWQLRQQGLIRVASVRPMQIRVPVTPATTTANAGSNTSANLQVAGQTAAAGVTRGQPVRQQTDTQQYGAQQQGEATVQSACVTPSTQVRQQSVAADVSEPIQQQVQENLEKIRQSLAAQQQQQQQQLRQQPGAVTAQQQLAHRQLSASAASQSSTAVGSNGGQPQVRQHYVLRQAEPGQTVLTPGQRIIQVGNQQVVLPPGHTLTPEIRQQILNNQQNLVQTKTKTALANLLNNRLSSGASTPDTTPPTPPVSAALQQQQQQQQQVPVNHNVVSQCSVVSGSTVVQPGSRVVPAGSAVPVGPGSYRLGVNTLQKGVSGPVVQRVGAAGSQYIGHDPNLKLPPDLCLLGCVFLVCGYQRTTPLDELRAWCRTIVQYGGEVEQVYCSRVTHVLCFYSKNNLVQAAMRDGKRCVTAYWLNDVITQQKVSPPWLALHLPVPYGDNERPGQNMVISISGFEDRERQCVKYMVESVGARYTGYFTKHNTHLVCRRPEGAKFVKAREWKKPVVNVQWLNELMLGAHNVAMMCAHQRYQQYLAEPPAASLQHRQQMALRMDVSQVPHLMAAWKAPIVVTRDIWSRFKENPPPRNKRKFQELEEERSPASRALTTISTNITDPAATTLPSSGELSHHHQQQQSPLNTPVRVLFSAVECSRALADTVRQLGGVVTLDPRHCTHLVMGRPQRTVKLLLALPSCSHVLSQRWLVDSEREGRLLEEAPYSLCAPHGDGDDSTSSESRDGEAFEKRFGFSLAATMARTNRDKLFEGVSFYVTPGVVPRRRLLWRIIEASGGCVENRLRPLRTLREQAGTRSHVIITCDADLHLLDDVLKNGLPIYNAEFVLGAVLRQSLDYVVSSYVRHQC